MKLWKTSLLLLSSLFAFASCEEEPIVEADDPRSNKYAHIEGYVQKGQLVRGSQVTAFVLDHELKATGKSYPANISDDLGAFAIDIKVEEPFLELRAEGYYFNEVTGEVSESPIYLEAIGNQQSTNLNINLLTTITKPRIKKLLAEGKGWATSTLTAQRELLTALGADETTEDFTDIDITGADKSDALLLALACIIQQDRSISEIVTLLQNTASEFEAEGKLSDKTVEVILANRSNVNPFDVAKNIACYYSAKSITGKNLPSFYRYLDDKYDADFIIEQGSIIDMSPEYSMNYGPIESSCEILSDIEFDIECADEDVTVLKEQILGPLYNVSIAIPENMAFEERTAVVVFKDKSGTELARKVFKQDANVQYVELQIRAGTKSSISIQDGATAMFKDGDKIGVNGIEYPLEVLSSDRANVKLPRINSYFFSFPAGSISKADHIARVTVDIPAEVTASTSVPYYAGLESYHGMEIPNPATIKLNPAVAILGIKPNGFDNIAYVVISGNNDDDVLSGTYTYVPNPDDLMYYPELNPEIVKGTGKTITIKKVDGSDVFYAPLAPIEYTNGFTVKVFDSAEQLIGEKSISNSFSLKAGLRTTISFNKSGLNGNQILYTTSNAMPVELMERRSKLLPEVTSNTYEGEKGLLVTLRELTYLPEDAFISCTNLTSVTLPECCKELKPGVFVGCKGLQTFNIPNHIDNIGYAAFEGCSSFRSFTGKFVSSDGRYLIKNGVLLAVAPYGLKTVSVEEGVTTIEAETFAEMSEVEVVYLPSSLQYIGRAAFHRNKSLKEIHCKAKTPPTKEDYALNVKEYAVKLYVPRGCKEAYSSWAYYFNDQVYEE